MSRGDPTGLDPGRRILAALERPGSTWAVLCGVLAVLTVFGAAEILLSPASSHSRRSILIVSNALAHLSYALLAPVLLHVLERHPFRRGRIPEAVGWHAAAALALGGIAVFVMQFGLHATVRPLASAGAVLERIGSTFRYNLHDILFIYALLAATASALDLYRRERRKDLEAVSLERALAGAKLEALRTRIDPHFVLNTLNALLPLLGPRPAAACDAIVRLGTLLRLSFRTSPSGLAPLREEEEYLRCFLALEEMRASDRLSVVLDFAPDVLDAVVPSLVLKPFVEAALRTGVFRRTGSAYVTVEARRDGADVVVRVTSATRGGDEPPPAPADDPGVEAARARLHEAFGDGSRVDVSWSATGDLATVLRFPMRRGSEAAAAPRDGAPAVPSASRPPAPRPAPLLDRPARVAGIAALLWLVTGLYFGSQEHLRAGLRPPSMRPPALAHYVAPLAHAAAWALLTPAIIALYRRFPLGRRPLRSVPVHLAAAALSAAFVVAVAPRPPASGSDPSPPEPYAARLASELPTKAGVYLLVVAALVVLDVARQARHAALRSGRLEAQLADARLAALRTQLHPHFVFNTLNGLLPLVTIDPEAAARVLVLLGDLFRASFRPDASPLVPLAEEVEFLRRYLELEAVRFRDRLSVRLDVDPEALGASVPSLVLQPLVENAVKHGVSLRPGPGCVRLAARRVGATLVVEVGNDAAPEGAAPAAASHGVGLANTRARLAQLYGEAASLEAGTAAPGEFRTVLRLPFSVAPKPAGAAARI